MLNACFDYLYRALGLSGGGFYPYFVTTVILSSNMYHVYSHQTSWLTRSLKVVTRIELYLFLLYPMTCILECRLGWERFRTHQEALERIKGMVGSKSKYHVYTLLQQILLLIYPSMLFLLEDGALGMLAVLPQFLVYIINYATVVRYSILIWTIEDLFKHLNHTFEESLAYPSSFQEYAISRICTIHKLLVDSATELNGIFQIQLLVCLLFIIVRCIIYPSIIVMVWLDSEVTDFKCYYGLGLIAIDLLHVTNIFHPPSMAVLQAGNTRKILRRIANKQVVDSEVVRFFLKKLTLQELKFSLLDLVEQNDLNIILVMQYITTRLFILMNF